MKKRINPTSLLSWLCLPCFLIVGSVSVSAADFETAKEAVKNMGVGWNLGNTLDATNGKRQKDVVASETTWGQPVTTPKLMTMMHEAGFGVIRVPVTWYPHMDEKTGDVDAQWMKRVHEVVDYVIDAGMYCLLNVHHDTGAYGDGTKSWLRASEGDYAEAKERYEHLWSQIANEFRDYDHHLLFESYNEMLDTIYNWRADHKKEANSWGSWCFASFNAKSGYDAANAASSYNAINSYAQSFVNVVRNSGGNNAQRNLVVNTYGACCGSGTWNAHLKDPLKEMKIPSGESDHIIFQVHSYPSVKNLNDTKAEVDDMVSALQEHLMKKGAPVIIGEWGTANAGETDYDVRRQNVLDFAEYFVTKTKAAGIGTIWWMGLSDGPSRTLPAFTQPDLARKIVEAYHGSSIQGKYPTVDDYDITYGINYTGDWQELNLYGSSLSLATYKGIRVEMAELPAAKALQVKCYGSTKDQYELLSSTSLATTINFSKSTLGSTINRITLQTNAGAQQVRLKKAFLIRANNTEQELSNFTPFWGCTVTLEGTLAGITHISAESGSQSDAIYTLSGQRVKTPRPGNVYIRNKKKFIVD